MRSRPFVIVLRAGGAVVGFLVLGVVGAATALAQGQYPPELPGVGPQEVGGQPAPAAVEAGGPLPFTGAEIALLLSIFTALVVTGALVLLAARRRARAA